MLTPKSSRRAFLKGAGSVAICLPLSDFFYNNGAICQTPEGVKPPKRLLTYSFSNGCDPSFWNYDVALSPLKDLKNHIAVMQGIANPVSEKGGGDAHQQGAAGLFVGQPMVSHYQSGGISLDQFVSEKFDVNTPLRQPLLLGVWKGFAGGMERPVTWYRRSWLSNGQPADVINNPLDAFRKIFANQDMDQSRLRTSILDSVISQYKDMTSDRAPYSQANKARLKDHLESIRSLEEKLQKFSSANDENKKCLSNIKSPPYRNKDHRGLLPYEFFSEAMDNHIELTAYAFKCGITNTANLTFNSAGEEYVVPSISPFVSEHSTSHYATEHEKNIFIEFRRLHMNKIKKIIELFTTIDDGQDRTLLDNTIVLAGTEFGESRYHYRSPQPFLIAGGGNTGVKLNQVIDVQGKKTANDLYRTVLNCLGFSNTNFGQLEYNTGPILELIKG